MTSTSALRLLGIGLAATCACNEKLDKNPNGTVADASANSFNPPSTNPDAAHDNEMDAGTANGGSAGSPTYTIDAGSHGGSPTDRDGGVTQLTDASAADAGPISIGGLDIDSSGEDQNIDLFGVAGHKLWLEVSEHQLRRMNAEATGEWHDMYAAEVGPTFADHVVVQDAETLGVADYGKMEIELVGVSTMRPWEGTAIPNIRIDADEFQAGARIDGFEHVRLNNSIVGSIFREHLTHQIYRALDYPAPRTSHVFLGSSVWGEGVWVPMTLLEMYKRRFCEDNAELIGGGATCPNMWEFAGDIGDGMEALPEDVCQIKECDDTRLADLAQALAVTPAGPGFKDALEPYISWTHFHQFQCLSWIMWTGDDMLHNKNNNLIIEREDGKLIWAPYSVDISAGQAWYQNTTLTGISTVAVGCQADAECWADTIAACETLVDEFDDLDPELLLDENVAQLSALGMMRDGDAERAAELRAWLVSRQGDVRGELEDYRGLIGGVDGGVSPDGGAIEDEP